MKIKLSKNQWEMIGKKTGWMNKKAEGSIKRSEFNEASYMIYDVMNQYYIKTKENVMNLNIGPMEFKKEKVIITPISLKLVTEGAVYGDVAIGEIILNYKIKVSDGPEQDKSLYIYALPRVLEQRCKIVLDSICNDIKNKV